MDNKHLVSIPRRVVLSSAVMASGPLLLRPPCLWAAGAFELPALSFIVVSDTHLGYRDQPRAAQRWEATAKEIDKAAGELVLHLGDVVDGGRESQYPVYLETRKLIRTKLYDIVTTHQDRMLALMHGHFHNGLRGWDDHTPVHEICFPSALYNLDRRLEAQHAPGYNPPEFRPGYTIVTIQSGEMRLAYKPVGAPVAVHHACRLRSIAR